MKLNDPLTPKEIRILKMLANGHNYATLRTKLKIEPATFHTQCYHIRKKTGLNNLLDRPTVRLHLHGSADALHYQEKKKTCPTAAQLKVLRALAAGQTYKQINPKSPQTAATTAYQACQRIGIKGQSWRRTAAIEDYLRKNDLLETPRPLLEVPENDPAFQ